MGAPGDFAAIETTNTGVKDSNPDGNHDVPMPAGVQVGELVLAQISTQSGSVLTPPSGWTQIYEEASSGGPRSVLSGIIADSAFVTSLGDNDGTATVRWVFSGSNRGTYISGRISGHGVDFSGGINGLFHNVAVVNEAGSIDPPSLTPAGGSQKFLWLALGHTQTGLREITSVPTNYTGGVIATNNSTSSGRSTTVWSHRELEASSDDPGAYTLTQSDAVYVGATVAIAPAS